MKQLLGYVIGTKDVRSTMIERHHLEILRQVHKHGSLTAAAESLHLTQSALSHSIKKLENLLEAPLWIKDGRKLQLTQTGQHLLHVAQRLLPQIEKAEETLKLLARGQQGKLSIGMECHPCYRWLLNIVGPYLHDWPNVDVDIKQKFSFGGLGALYNYDIDILVTPDPVDSEGLLFTPVFNYEQVLVVSENHKLASSSIAYPNDLSQETLITYPVPRERLDIFTHFLLPDQCLPKQHKTIEDTDMMLQMVAANRGVCALPKWLIEQYTKELSITPIKLGEQGIQKTIYLGVRKTDIHTKYLKAFLDLAQTKSYSGLNPRNRID